MNFRQRLQQPPVTEDMEVIAEAYRHVFSSAEGRIVLDHIVQRLCGVDNNLFVASDHGLAYNLARRDVGLEIARLAEGLTGRKTPEVKLHE